MFGSALKPRVGTPGIDYTHLCPREKEQFSESSSFGGYFFRGERQNADALRFPVILLRLAPFRSMA